MGSAMSSSPDLPRRVVIVGDGSIAIGVAGLLLSAGITPALVRPAIVDTSSVPEASSGGIERHTSPGWTRELLVYRSLHDAIEVLGDADWILEASGVSIEQKKILFRHIDGCRKRNSLVTSDESITSVKRLTKGFSDRFCRDFAVTHFFVPVERLRLAEVIHHDLMAEPNRGLVRRICAEMLGRQVLVCRDSPGFVANRIGIYFMALGLHEGSQRRTPVATADGAVRSALGTPRSGVFGLIDLIGVDVFLRLLASLRGQLADADELQRYGAEDSAAATLVAKGRTGKQAGMGFYKYDGSGKPCAAIEWGNFRYETISADQEAEVESLYGEAVAARVRSYALHVCRAAGVSPEDAAMAMELGYGWKPRVGLGVPSA